LSVPSTLVEAEGHKSYGGRLLSWIKMNNVVSVEGSRFTGKYSASVMWNLCGDSVSTQHSVQLSTQIEQWQGNCVDGVQCYRKPLTKGTVKPSRNSHNHGRVI